MRLEGAWPDRNGDIYFVDTSGGDAGQGALWRYRPFRGKAPKSSYGEGELEAVFVSDSPESADRPDNVTISPRGGILLCEDGANPEGTDTGLRLLGVTKKAETYALGVNNVVIEEALPDRPAIAPNDYRGAEWAGVCFDPTGRWLFVNIQTPGITFAIEGPFWKGGL